MLFHGLPNKVLWKMHQRTIRNIQCCPCWSRSNIIRWKKNNSPGHTQDHQESVHDWVARVAEHSQEEEIDVQEPIIRRKAILRNPCRPTKHANLRSSYKRPPSHINVGNVKHQKSTKTVRFWESPESDTQCSTINRTHLNGLDSTSSDSSDNSPPSNTSINTRGPTKKRRLDDQTQDMVNGLKNVKKIQKNK